MRGAGALVFVAMLAVAATGGAGTLAGGPASAGESATAGESTTESDPAGSAPPDPDEDVLGWEDGVWHDESIDVDASDGLTDRELELVVARGMARVEVLRDREFQQSVPVEVVPRSTYREVVRWTSATTPTARAWENQLWEALFVVGESTDAFAESVTVTAERVGGLYVPLTDRIFVVSEGGERPTVDEATVIHELTHALADQHQGFEAFSSSGASLDAQFASSALTEGEANYVQYRYEDRCASGEWECPDPPAGGPTAAPYLDGPLPEYNLGVQVLGIQPYSDGPPYVADLLADGGWDAVDAAYDDPPVSTEQVIHPERRDEPPEPMAFDPAPRGNWSVVAPPGSPGYRTVGEAAIFTMFFYQGRAFDNPVVDWRSFVEPDRGPDDRFDYTAGPSAGWANDRLYVYAAGDRRGYVWTTQWDTRADAREFRAAYREVLAGHGATRVDDGTFTVSDGGFADAFRVTREGRTVTVANAPSVAALSDVHSAATNVSLADDRTGRNGVSRGNNPQFYNDRSTIDFK